MASTVVNQATVKINFVEAEISSADQKAFQLTVTVSEPTNMPLYVRTEYPDYPFVYQILDLNSVDEAPFIRVATIDDLRNMDISYSNANDFVRRNIYVKKFDTAEEILGAKELMIRNLRVLYSDINTLFTYISTVDATSSIILPTYVETKVDAYISDLLSMRYEIQDYQTKIQLLEKTVIPTLTFNLEVVASQNEIVEKIWTYIDDISPDLPALDTLQVSIDNLHSKFTEATNSIQSFSSRLTNIGALTASALVSTNGLTDLVQKGQLEVKLNTIKDSYSDGFQEVLFDRALFRADTTLIKRSLEIFRNINIEQIVGTDTLKQLQDLIRVNERKIKDKMKLAEREVIEYKQEIETLKGDIQIVEAELVKLVPNIDLTRPESFWFVNVNIET